MPRAGKQWREYGFRYVGTRRPALQWPRRFRNEKQFSGLGAVAKKTNDLTRRPGQAGLSFPTSAEFNDARNR